MAKNSLPECLSGTTSSGNEMPSISCLLAIGGFDEYTELAINSILNQTFSDFELIILVNGDASLMDFIEPLCRDPRIVLHYSPIRQLAHSLNVGLEMARAPIIARMDSDDIAMPERFARQINMLRQNERLLLVSCETYPIDAKGGRLPRKGSTSSWVNRYLWLKNPILHPGAMFRRKEVIEIGAYSGVIAQDYDLWLRLERKYGRFFTITPEKLIEFRHHAGQSRGRIDSYAASAGLLLREFMIRRDIRFLFGAALFVLRGLARGRSAA